MNIPRTLRQELFTCNAPSALGDKCKAAMETDGQDSDCGLPTAIDTRVWWPRPSLYFDTQSAIRCGKWTWDASIVRSEGTRSIFLLCLLWLLKQKRKIRNFKHKRNRREDHKRVEMTHGRTRRTSSHGLRNDAHNHYKTDLRARCEFLTNFVYFSLFVWAPVR